MVELVDNKIELVFDKPEWLDDLKEKALVAEGYETTYHLPQTFLESQEDKFNVITHGLGFVLSLLGFFFVFLDFFNSGSLVKAISGTVFSFSLLLVYGSSTAYHGLYRTFLKNFLQKIDHIMIFILIAGSFTPFTLVSLKGTFGYILFGLIWFLAIVGIALKLRAKKDRPVFFTTYYLLMGWVGVIAVYPLSKVISTFALVTLLAGGLSYTLGVIFFSWNKLKYNHGIWHLFVLLGSACHFVAVYLALA